MGAGYSGQGSTEVRNVNNRPGAAAAALIEPDPPGSSHAPGGSALVATTPSNPTFVQLAIQHVHKVGQCLYEHARSQLDEVTTELENLKQLTAGVEGIGEQGNETYTHSLQEMKQIMRRQKKAHKEKMAHLDQQAQLITSQMLQWSNGDILAKMEGRKFLRGLGRVKRLNKRFKRFKRL